MVNIATAALTPISLPSCDHIAQIHKEVAYSEVHWSFLKTDHKVAYKQLPHDPQFANLTIVALRCPTTGRWKGFIPKVLLFGAVSEVIRYNCFSMAFAVLVNRIFGIPLISYYGDFGALIPESVGARELSAIDKGAGILLVIFKDTKSELGNEVKFLRLLGKFPSTANGMTLSISLPEDKARRRSEINSSVACNGSIPHKDLEKLVGKLSFSQTSVFGKFGRSMPKPLFGKLKSTPYEPRLSGFGRDIWH